MRDLYHNVLATQVLNPAVATTTKTSATIDLQGFNSTNVVFSLGQSGDTLSVSLYWTLTLQQSNDNVTFIPVASTDVSSGNVTTVVNAPSLDKTAYSIGYIGGMRYLQALATPTGTMASGTPIGIVALRGTAAYKPVFYP
jgi:hypothetical protein